MDDILKASIEAFIKAYANDAKNLFGDIFDQGKQFLEIGLKKYLLKAESRYSRVKTLLHGNTPQDLYSIYYHLNIFVNETEFYKTTNIASLFSNIKNCITIIGEAGSGKSTLVRHLFLNTISTQFAIPILIELRHLGDFEGRIETAIQKILLKEDIAVSEDVIDRLLTKGKFVFFLDGFDEIPSSVKYTAIQSINDFKNRYDGNKFLLTSRPHADAEHMDLFHTHRIGKLDTLNDIFGFIRKQLSVDEDNREIAEKIIESIRKNDQRYIFSFLTNPLLLSIYILAFQTNSLIPAKKHIFYERVIIALFSEHDSRSKLTLKRERLSNLSQEEIEDILQVFCLYSFFENKYDWNKIYIRDKFRTVCKLSASKNLSFESDKLIKDLTVGLSLWTEDGGVYSFAHRTLQEYYTARFVKNLISDEKANFYHLIIEKYVKKSQHPYLLSLLSFLEEMDTFFYYKYFKLPILKEFLSHLHIADSPIALINNLKYFGFDLRGRQELISTGEKITTAKYIPLIEKAERIIHDTFETFSAKKQLSEYETAKEQETRNENVSKKDIIKGKTNIGIDLDEWDLFDNISETEDEEEQEEEMKEEKSILINGASKFNIDDKEEKILMKIFKPILESIIKEIEEEISNTEDYISTTEHDENAIIGILSLLAKND